MGIITFAFGMGGPLANFAGLLHMTMHSLTKSAIFFAVGHIAQVKGTQKIADIRGLTASHPPLGWSLVVGVVAIAGLPPLRHLHERVPGRDLDLRAPAAAGDAAGGRAARRVRRADAAAARPRLRRADRHRPSRSRRRSCRCWPISHWCCSPGIYLPAAAGRLVPAVARGARMTDPGALASLLATRHARAPTRAWPRVEVDDASWARWATRLAQGHWEPRRLWGDGPRVHWRCATTPPPRSPS